ncbi:hypothetical protein ACJRO7_030188 [Eucalyptus globulus]|uniref:Uncharacterized protein n=1 Tax=Eucalyptus globulus TaxID=34317 RepID=A0ABD3JNL0_EUCGL
MSCGMSARCLNTATAAGISPKPKPESGNHGGRFSSPPFSFFSRSSVSVSPPTPRFAGSLISQRTSVRRDSSTRPGGPPPGGNESRTVLDAFFLGKALAEALNERVESVVGEFLSTVGRLQAEQQKQVQEFQEDVFERAKKAKEKAAREAMEAQGLIPTSAAANTANGSVVSPTLSSTPNSVSPSVDSNADYDGNDPVVGVSNDG